MPKSSDEEYEKIMADLKARLDQIEQKQPSIVEPRDNFWLYIVAGWLASIVLCGAVIIYFS